MDFLNPELFLGFPITSVFSQKLQKANPHLVTHFINASGEYLRETSHKGIPHLGKGIGKQATLEELELLEANIYSIAKRLVGEYDFSQCPAVLFPTLPAKI